MAYRIVYKKSVFRDLGKLDKKEARRVLSRLEKDLALKADSCPPLKGKFAGLRGYRVARVPCFRLCRDSLSISMAIHLQNLRHDTPTSL